MGKTTTKTQKSAGRHLTLRQNFRLVERKQALYRGQLCPMETYKKRVKPCQTMVEALDPTSLPSDRPAVPNRPSLVLQTL